MNHIIKKITQTSSVYIGILAFVLLSVLSVGVFAATYIDGGSSVPGFNNTAATITTGDNNQVKSAGLGISTVATYGGDALGISDLNTKNADGSGLYSNTLVVLGRTLFGGSVGIANPNDPGKSLSGWTHNTQYAVDINGYLNATNILAKIIEISSIGFSDGFAFLKYLTPTPTGNPIEYPVCVQNTTAAPYTAGDVRTCTSSVNPTVVTVDVLTTGSTSQTGPGTTGQIEYYVTNADGCQVTAGVPGWSAPVSFYNGAASFGSAFYIEQTTTFALFCYNNSGSMDADAITIVVN